MVANSHHFEEELDPNLHSSEKLDPDLHQSKKLDPNPHKVMRIRNPGTKDCLLAGAKNSDDEYCDD